MFFTSSVVAHKFQFDETNTDRERKKENTNLMKQTQIDKEREKKRKKRKEENTKENKCKLHQPLVAGLIRCPEGPIVQNLKYLILPIKETSVKFVYFDVKLIVFKYIFQNFTVKVNFLLNLPSRCNLRLPNDY